jgi:hypothetical protein
MTTKQQAVHAAHPTLNKPKMPAHASALVTALVTVHVNASQIAHWAIKALLQTVVNGYTAVIN